MVKYGLGGGQSLRPTPSVYCCNMFINVLFDEERGVPALIFDWMFLAARLFCLNVLNNFQNIKLISTLMTSNDL